MQKITCATFLVCYLAIVGYHRRISAQVIFLTLLTITFIAKHSALIPV